MKFHLALFAGAIHHSVFSISKCCLGGCQVTVIAMLEVLLPADRRRDMDEQFVYNF